MLMLNKGYMISHMRNADASVNTRNVTLAAACEAAELFQCLIGIDDNFSDWTRFVARLYQYMEKGKHEKVHDLCQSLYAMKHLTEELEGLYLVREDPVLCGLYYQVFVGMLDLMLFSAESLMEMLGRKDGI